MIDMQTAQLWSGSTLAATVSVPADGAVVPDVVVWQGRYFVSPTVGYGSPLVFSYQEGTAYVLPPEEEQG
jgi:hypothetical protein